MLIDSSSNCNRNSETAKSQLEDVIGIIIRNMCYIGIELCKTFSGTQNTMEAGFLLVLWLGGVVGDVKAFFLCTILAQLLAVKR